MNTPRYPALALALGLALGASAQTAEQPLTQAPANWPVGQVGVGTIPHRYASWQRFWA